PLRVVPSVSACFLSPYSSRAHRAPHSFPTRRSSDLRDLGCDGHVVLQVAKRVAQLFQSDLLHVTAFGRLTGGDKLLPGILAPQSDRKSTRLNSSHVSISYAVFCLKKKKKAINNKRET